MIKKIDFLNYYFYFFKYLLRTYITLNKKKNAKMY